MCCADTHRSAQHISTGNRLAPLHTIAALSSWFTASLSASPLKCTPVLSARVYRGTQTKVTEAVHGLKYLGLITKVSVSDPHRLINEGAK